MPDTSLHLTPDELDLLLDEGLPTARSSHLETCEACRTLAEETRELVAALGSLKAEAPSVSFADRVVAKVQKETPALAGHVTLEELDLWVAGALPVARESHLQGCAECQELANREKLLVMALERLPLFDPAPGFATRVLDQVELPVTSLRGALRLWKTRVERRPMAVAAVSGVAVLLGGSVAASAAWAAGNQDLITGAGQWALATGQAWFWTGVGTLEAQGWYQALSGAFTPGRAAAAAAGITALYAAGIVMLRRLIALPQAARAHA